MEWQPGLQRCVCVCQCPGVQGQQAATMHAHWQSILFPCMEGAENRTGLNAQSCAVHPPNCDADLALQHPGIVKHRQPLRRAMQPGGHARPQQGVITSTSHINMRHNINVTRSMSQDCMPHLTPASPVVYKCLGSCQAGWQCRAAMGCRDHRHGTAPAGAAAPGRQTGYIQRSVKHPVKHKPYIIYGGLGCDRHETRPAGAASRSQAARQTDRVGELKHPVVHPVDNHHRQLLTHAHVSGGEGINDRKGFWTLTLIAKSARHAT